jgi:hypothetical protein
MGFALRVRRIHLDCIGNREVARLHRQVCAKVRRAGSLYIQGPFTAEPSRRAAVSADGKFVAFLSDRDGQTDVWITQRGSGEFRNLTRGSVPGLVNTSVRTLAFSPDGPWSRCVHKRAAVTDLYCAGGPVFSISIVPNRSFFYFVKARAARKTRRLAPEFGARKS